MNIQEAVKEALKTGRAIYRKNKGTPNYITPTNTDLCCIGEMKVGVGEDAKTKYGVRWNPRLSDLLAEDWDVVSGDD